MEHRTTPSPKQGPQGLIQHPGPGRWAVGRVGLYVMPVSAQVEGLQEAHVGACGFRLDSSVHLSGALRGASGVTLRIIRALEGPNKADSASAAEATLESSWKGMCSDIEQMSFLYGVSRRSLGSGFRVGRVLCASRLAGFATVHLWAFARDHLGLGPSRSWRVNIRELRSTFLKAA